MTAQAAPVASPDITIRQSINWAGYVVTGDQGSMRSVSARWTVPGVKGYPAGGGYYTLSSFWVGLDGITVNGTPPHDLVQAGVDLNSLDEDLLECEAWWELETGQTGAQTLTDPVHPGDRMTVTITHVQGLTFAVLIAREGQQGPNWQFHQNLTFPPGTPAPLLNSAEVIVEAPAYAEGKAGKLTNFGTVRFEDVRVNGQPLAGFAAQATRYQMVDNTSLPPTGDNLLADPGSLDGTDPTSFAVTWRNYGTKRVIIDPAGAFPHRSSRRS